MLEAEYKSGHPTVSLSTDIAQLTPCFTNENTEAQKGGSDLINLHSRVMVGTYISKKEINPMVRKYREKKIRG